MNYEIQAECSKRSSRSPLEGSSELYLGKSGSRIFRIGIISSRFFRNGSNLIHRIILRKQNPEGYLN